MRSEEGTIGERLVVPPVVGKSEGMKKLREDREDVAEGRG
jgi:hypothetical protein